MEEKGVKFDEGKNRLDLLPTEFLEGVGHTLSFGANKYDDENWRGGIKYHRVYGSLLRHLFSWRKGEVLDPESGMPHLWHVGCNLAFLITFEAHPEVYKEFNDLYCYPQLKHTGI